MVMNDTLAAVLSSINNYEKLGKRKLETNQNSKLIREVLQIMKELGYLGETEIVENGKGGMLNITLLGRLNKAGVIKPRYRIKVTDIEKYEKRYLPAKNFGVLIISTNQGLMTHKQAKEKHLGGTLISYVY